MPTTCFEPSSLGGYNASENRANQKIDSAEGLECAVSNGQSEPSLPEATFVDLLVSEQPALSHRDVCLRLAPQGILGPA